MLTLQKRILKENKTIKISGSKSISNRLLILNHIFLHFKIHNLSNSQDTQLLQKALESDSETIDIHHAGTAMRFLTSYLAIKEGKTTVLTGSDRMKQRPIKDLVSALRSLGAEIEYLENEGFPPLQITGKKIVKNSVSISANVSSQFITSLMLIGAKLENGIRINLEGEITSRPYLEMTRKILKELGIECQISDQLITVKPLSTKEHFISNERFTVESDWSSASYFYSLAAIGKRIINLQNFKSTSIQGDSVLQTIYCKYFGINTICESGEHLISLMPIYYFPHPKEINLNLNDAPDIAQTICVTATALKIPFHLTGLATLKVKETDRLEALKNELLKIGCRTEITDTEIKSVEFFETTENISIKTYNDHRMAMSFAPFALVKSITIENPEVVEKSYTQFWEDFDAITDTN
ncbi:3-phosphoshikimate 1-carboxyvinyltransferase [Halpernia frigidisoli]|uniref:3-phosphoshikimate 1-carboxyvinyltransferase n=1 Tax=Halpernia frigidisoli TaxID=1125876 RepID=A0A1I3J8W1_9FLAO|nr:3-phosphoshikimate 1-carboxyvinyltransferase [Halpernia frigidisoli]SFI56649.1 3-phosphoshikimate 1-carboxyvinyltransferase [Halpernia frigidisoli]